METEKEEKLSHLNPTAIRMPSALKEKLRKAAKENQQSLNTEIVRRLEKSFDDDAAVQKFTIDEIGVLMKDAMKKFVADIPRSP